jgi:hypothetical protein
VTTAEIAVGAALLRWGGWIKVAVEFLASVAVILGVFIFFAFEREDARRNARVEHVLQYIAQFQEGEIAANRTTLIRSFFAHQAELRQLKERAAPPAVIQSWVAKLARDTPRDGSRADVQSAVFAVTEWFDQLALCVEKRICEESTAKEYFGPYAAQFHCLYKLVIDELRDDLILSDFGRGVESLAPERVACEPVAPTAPRPPSS